MPPEKNKNSSTIVIVVILVLLAVFIYLYSNSQKKQSTSNNTEPTTEQKAALFNELNGGAPSAPLSNEEKNQIMKDMGASAAKSQQQTDTEKRAVIDSFGQ